MQPSQQSQLWQPSEIIILILEGDAQFINLPSGDFTDKQPPQLVQTSALDEKTELLLITNITNTKHEIWTILILF